MKRAENTVRKLLTPSYTVDPVAARADSECNRPHSGSRLGRQTEIDSLCEIRPLPQSVQPKPREGVPLSGRAEGFIPLRADAAKECRIDD